MCFTNNYIFKELEIGMLIVLNYDLIHLKTIEGETNFDKRLFRGEIGTIQELKNEPPSDETSDDVSYVVRFEDKNAGFDFFDRWINQIKVSRDKFISLILPYPFQDIEDHFMDCYLQEMYAQPVNLKNPPIFECKQT